MEFKWFSCIFKKQKNLNIQYTAAGLDIIGLGLFYRIQIQPDPILFAGDMDPDHFCGIKIPTNRIGFDPFLDFNNKKVVESAAQKIC